ncbi:hypothetical protein D3C81_1859810 [compost metagenome]
MKIFILRGSVKSRLINGLREGLSLQVMLLGVLHQSQEKVQTLPWQEPIFLLESFIGEGIMKRLSVTTKK